MQDGLVERAAVRGKGQRNPVHLTADEHRSLDAVGHRPLGPEALK